VNIPPLLITVIQGVLVLAGVFLLWTSWQIRVHHHYEFMKTIGGRMLAAPQLIEREFALYQMVFGLALLADVAAWVLAGLSFATATIITTAITVIGTGWRGTLIRMHDQRHAARQ